PVISNRMGLQTEVLVSADTACPNSECRPSVSFILPPNLLEKESRRLYYYCETITLRMEKINSIMWNIRLPKRAAICSGLALMVIAPAQALEVPNLALSAYGARARSWETAVPIIPEHEPAKAVDASFHTWWQVRAEDLPADLGVEWPTPQIVSSIIVRY